MDERTYRRRRAAGRPPGAGAAARTSGRAPRGRRAWLRAGTGALRGGGRAKRGLGLGALAGLLGLAGLSCGDGPIDPGALRFGQVGEVRVSVAVPLQYGQGWLQQVLSWQSDGSWALREAISYGERVGDESLKRNPGVPLQYADGYATLISEVNESRLRILDLDRSLAPQCGLAASRVTFLIRDDVREEERSWTRCANGMLTTLQTENSGPDEHASRIVHAGIRAWRRTLGSDSVSIYVGSLPFGTLERGERTGARFDRPVAFRSPGGAPAGEAPPGWEDFWNVHSEGARPSPAIDWEDEMVLFAVVGERDEVGDSVEVRRVLPIADGTRIVVAEQVPGDFCAPLHRPIWPYHLVVAPKTEGPVLFSQVAKERVPCGAG